MSRRLVKRERSCDDRFEMAPEGDEQHPFEWAGPPAVDPAPAAAQPRPQRRPPARLLAVVAGALAVAVIAVVALDGGGGNVTQLSTPVTLAADVTAAQPGFQFTLTVDASVAGRTIRTSAVGAIDERPAATGSMEVSANGQTFKELLLGPDFYMQLPNAPSPWVKVEAAAYEHALGVTDLGGDDPSQTLRFLQATGTVAKLGQATVRGVPTTHYHGLADLSRYASVVAPALRYAAQQNADQFQRLTGSTQVPIDVWVDSKDRVRQLEIAPPSICTKAGPVNETTTIDFFGFGSQPRVTAPPALSVTDMTSQLVASATRSLSLLGC
jgi:hypothetical protein